MWMPLGTKATVKQKGAAKRRKSFILQPVPAGQYLVDGSFQVVIRNTLGNPAPEFKGVHMSCKKGFLLHMLKGFKVKTAAVVQNQPQHIHGAVQ